MRSLLRVVDVISDDLCFVVKGSVFACCDGINLILSWLWYVRLVCFLLVLDGSDFSWWNWQVSTLSMPVFFCSVVLHRWLFWLTCYVWVRTYGLCDRRYCDGLSCFTLP